MVGMMSLAEERHRSKGPSLQVVDGGIFYLLNPNQDVIDPRVIAHSLSQICRFTGHTKLFYSVAQHCVLVSQVVPDFLALDGLLHDASEAFIGDISQPMKQALNLRAPGALEGIEGRIHAAIAERFGTGWPHHPAIKDADNVVLATEKRDVMSRPILSFGAHPAPLEERIEALEPEEAMYQWLDRFEELKHG